MFWFVHCEQIGKSIRGILWTHFLFMQKKRNNKVIDFFMEKDKNIAPYRRYPLLWNNEPETKLIFLQLQ